MSLDLINKLELEADKALKRVNFYHQQYLDLQNQINDLIEAECIAAGIEPKKKNDRILKVVK